MKKIVLAVANVFAFARPMPLSAVNKYYTPYYRSYVLRAVIALILAQQTVLH